MEYSRSIAASNTRSRILIIDDSKTALESMESNLADERYDIQTAMSGEDGLEIALNSPPDLILLDVVMGPGMDGFQTCRELKAHDATRDVPVVLITAVAHETESIVRGFSEGAVDYVNKDTFNKNLEEFRTRIRSRLSQYRSLLDSDRVQRYTKELLASREILEKLALGRPVGEVLEELLETTRKIGSEVVYSLCLGDVFNTHDIVDRVKTPPDEFCARLSGKLKTGWTKGANAPYCEREHLVVRDVFEAPEWSAFAAYFAKEGVRSFAAYPLVSSEYECLGVFLMLGRTAGEPGEENLRLLEQTAQLASVALEREADRQRLLGALEDEKRANFAKTRFLAKISHDIRSPLTSVLGFPQILSKATNLVHEQRVYLKTIETEGFRLLGLIDKLIEKAALETGRISLTAVDFDLSELVRGLAKGYKDRVDGYSRMVFSFDPGNLAEGELVRGDMDWFRGVLDNLLSNAVKFTALEFSEQGKLGVGEIHFQVNRTGVGRYHFRVKDNGPGFDEADTDKLFAPFERGEREGESNGHGLGLSIVKDVLELMGSDIVPKSESGQGAEFSFSVDFPPAQGKVEPRAEREERDRLKAGCSVSALVVEDGDNDRQVLRELLELAGVDVEDAPNGQAAIDSLREYLPDLVFLDLNLGDMDGYQVQDALRKFLPADRFSNIVWVAVTGDLHAHSDRRDRFSAFIKKPYRAQQIYYYIDTLLDVEFDIEHSGNENGDSIFEQCVESVESIGLDSGILVRLRENLADHEYAVSKRMLGEIAQGGDGARAFAECMGNLLDRREYGKMLSALERV